MVAELSDAQARQVLAQVGAPAADPARYEGRRIDRGWSFGWRDDAGPPPVGTVAWVVADNEKCQSQPLNMRAADVIQVLMGEAD